MPTDGADFGRTRPCYGKAYTMARDGAHEASVADCVVRGVELDIMRNGGAPAFPAAVDAVLLACITGDRGKLLHAAETIGNLFVDSPLTRHLSRAVEQVGLSLIAAGGSPSRQEVAERLVVRTAESRCCDGMHGYVARNRTHDLQESGVIVESIKSYLPHAPSTQDLAKRMLTCSAKGLPAKAPKMERIDHSLTSLNDHEL